MRAYVLAKDIHVTRVTISFILFFIRGLWMIVDSELFQGLGLRVPPYGKSKQAGISSCLATQLGLMHIVAVAPTNKPLVLS